MENTFKPRLSHLFSIIYFDLWLQIKKYKKQLIK